MGLLDDRSAFEEILGEFGSELECSGIAKKSDLTSLLSTSPVQLAIRPVLQVNTLVCLIIDVRSYVIIIRDDLLSFKNGFLFGIERSACNQNLNSRELKP